MNPEYVHIIHSLFTGSRKCFCQVTCCKVWMVNSRNDDDENLVLETVGLLPLLPLSDGGTDIRIAPTIFLIRLLFVL